MEIKKFGVTKDGQEAKLYIMKNQNGMEVAVTDLGAVLVDCKVPDKDGNLRDVVLGYETFEQYETNRCFFGATIGRNGNRIGNAEFELNGKKYTLAVNNGKHNLHSGPNGYQIRMWDVETDIDEEGEESVTFLLQSPNMDQGYPGNLDVEVTYTLTDDNELMIDYYGMSDEDTIMNMTNHSFFNLNGEGSGQILNHKVTINADYYTSTDEGLIPDGEYADVTGTPMDFRMGKTIGQDIEADFVPLHYAHGYDHNFVVNDGEVQEDANLIVTAEGDQSGIVMEVYSDLPAVQFYTATGLKEDHGKAGKAYGRFDGFCFETQYCPDAIHHENFASPILRAEEERMSLTVYRFSVKED